MSLFYFKATRRLNWLSVACLVAVGLAPTAHAQNATLLSKRLGEPLLNVTANGDSRAATISSDGNVIAFRTNATNTLGPNSPQGLYVFQRTTGAITHISARVSLSNSDPELSGDGRYVVFDETGDTTNIVRQYNNERPHTGIGGITPRQKLALAA